MLVARAAATPESYPVRLSHVVRRFGSGELRRAYIELHHISEAYLLEIFDASLKSD
jgi:hypothetical protein